MEKDLEEEMEATCFKYNWKKMETATQDRARLEELSVCGLCCTARLNKSSTCAIKLYIA